MTKEYYVTKDGIEFELPSGVDPRGNEARTLVARLRAQSTASPSGQESMLGNANLNIAGFDTGVPISKGVEAGLVSAGRGLMNTVRGVSNLTGIGEIDPESEIVSRAYEKAGEEYPVVSGVSEVVGEAAPWMIAGGPIGAIRGAKKRVAAAAGLGAAEGAAIISGSGGDENESTKGAAVGGLTAGTLEVLLPRAGRLLSSLYKRVRGTAPSSALITAKGSVTEEGRRLLEESGTSLDEIYAQARQEFGAEDFNADEIARKTFLESQGVDPTRAQVTRTADDFQLQQEMAKRSSKTREALERQDAILTSRFDQKVLDTMSNIDSPINSVTHAVVDKATKLDDAINDLYKRARSVAKEDKVIKPSSMGLMLRKKMSSNTRAGGNVEAAIGLLKERGVMDKNYKIIGKVDVETAESIRQDLNSLYDPMNGFGNEILRKLKNSLDDDVFRSTGSDLFKEARAAKHAFEKDLTRAKISRFDSRKSNLVRDMLENKDGVNPDYFVDKVVFGKKWRATDLQQVKDYILTDEGGKKAWDDLRAESLENIKERAFEKGPVDAMGFKPLSRANLEKAIKDVGESRMKVLFTSDERKFLKDMLDVTKLREPVRMTQQGKGPSAQAIRDLAVAGKEGGLISSMASWLHDSWAGGKTLKAPSSRKIIDAETGEITKQAGIAGGVSYAASPAQGEDEN